MLRTHCATLSYWISSLLKVHDLKQSFLIKHSAISSFLNIHSDAHVSVCHKFFNAFNAAKKNIQKNLLNLFQHWFPWTFCLLCLIKLFYYFLSKFLFFSYEKNAIFLWRILIFFFDIFRAFLLTDLFHCSTSTEEELKHKIAQSLKKVLKKFLLKEMCSNEEKKSLGMEEKR